MKTIFMLIISVQFAYGQCDEYYLNELISGSDEKCYFSNGSPIRFCRSLRGVSIDGNTFDTYQWDGISPQYITLSKNGGIAGTLVLKLNEREFVVDLNGCGKRTYSISFNKEEYNDYFRNKEIKERQLQYQNELAKTQIKEKLNANQILEAARVYESKNLNDSILFNEIQNRILKISIDKQPNDDETFNLLLSKLGEDKLLTLSQGSYILSSDTIIGLTLRENNTGHSFQLDDKMVIEKSGEFDRINQFSKKIDIKTTITLNGVKLNTQWDGKLSYDGVSMRFFKANKKGKTIILGGVKETPPSKYTNVEIVPGELKNISFDAKLELKKGKIIYLYEVYLNGQKKLVKAAEGEEILDVDWFYF